MKSFLVMRFTAKGQVLSTEGFEDQAKAMDAAQKLADEEADNVYVYEQFDVLEPAEEEEEDE